MRKSVVGATSSLLNVGLKLCVITDVGKMCNSVLVWKPLDICPLGRLKIMWEDDVETDPMLVTACKGESW